MGRIGRPHGIDGDVVVALTTNRDERVAPGSVLTTADGRTLRVTGSRPHQGRFVVSFDGVSDRGAAEDLRGAELLAPPIDDPDELWVHELIGATVFDADGVDRGRVESVLDNPASDLLVLESGALVPVRFVTAHEPGERIDIDAPDGLFDDVEEGR